MNCNSCKVCSLNFNNDINIVIEHLESSKCYEYDRNTHGFMYVYKLYKHQIAPLIFDTKLSNIFDSLMISPNKKSNFNDSNEMDIC